MPVVSLIFLGIALVIAIVVIVGGTLQAPRPTQAVLVTGCTMLFGALSVLTIPGSLPRIAVEIARYVFVGAFLVFVSVSIRYLVREKPWVGRRGQDEDGGGGDVL